jgi:multidrug efflux pump subunit AcrA (membrane-fusion protein)
MADERYDSQDTYDRTDTEHRLPAPPESGPAHALTDGHDDYPPAGHGSEEHNEGHGSRKPLFWFVVIFLLIVIAVLFFGWLERHGDSEDTKKRAEAAKNSKPIVEATKLQQPNSKAGLVVPGTTIPLTQAYVYARANGYLKKRYVDIGDHVKANQLLAIIDAPDLDAQVVQARQQVAQAEQQLEQQKSQLALATVTVQRYRVLVQKGVFSRQDGDQQETNYSSAIANVAAAQRNVDAYKANLQHQIALQSYEQVRAPFAGVITERDVDEGALISAAGGTSGAPAPAPQGQTSSTGGSAQAGQSNSAGSSGSAASSATSAQTPGQGGPLFGIAQVQRLRILVSVPEGYAPAIRVGQQAPIAFQEFQGAPMYAEVTRTSNSIDANTRTMLVELQIDNAQGKLIPGMYAVVTFPPAAGAQVPLLVSGDAIAIRHDQSAVATVVDGKIHYVPVTIGRDFGTAVEIMTGLKAGDMVVTDVTDDVVEGAPVEVHETKSPEQKPAAAPAQNTPPGGSSQYGNQGITDQNLQGQQTQQNQGKGSNNSKSASSASKP